MKFFEMTVTFEMKKETYSKKKFAFISKDLFIGDFLLNNPPFKEDIVSQKNLWYFCQ